MAHNNYTLCVTAGSSYDPSNHKIVAVNSPTPMVIESDHASVSLNIRIQGYHGLPHSSPANNPYFSIPDYTKHQYSISFSFTPSEAIPDGDDLVFGNDFDHPIRDRLPPAFGTAFKIVKWAVDPGLEADVYSDKPWMFGPFLSSIDKLWLGSENNQSAKPTEGQKENLTNGRSDHESGKSQANFHDEIGILVEEGGVSDGMAYRQKLGIPDTAAARKKYFLVKSNRHSFKFEAGRPVYADFGNPYLDFNKFALRLPGFHLPIMSYWDGQPLRYVLKNRVTGVVYLVVLFSLYLNEDINEDGTLKEGVDLRKEKVATVQDDNADESCSGSEEDEENSDAATNTGKNIDEKRAQYSETNADDVD